MKSSGEATSNSFLSNVSFRITGENNTTTISGLAPEHDIELNSLSFDCYKLPDAEELTLKLKGALSYLPDIPEPTPIKVDLRYRSTEDFDLRFSGGKLFVAKLAKFVNISQVAEETGSIEPSLRLNAYPGKTLILSLDLLFDGIRVKSKNFPVSAQSGELVALAELKLPEKRLRITTAEVNAGEFSGALSGFVYFSGEKPELDLSLEVRKIPLIEILQTISKTELEKYGDLVLKFDQLNNFRIGIKGPITKPQVEALADVTNGLVEFAPKLANLPTFKGKLDLVKIGWTTSESLPQGALVLKEGEFKYPPLNIDIYNILATSSLNESIFTIENLTGSYKNSPITLSGYYDITNKKGEFNLTGTLNELEKLPFIKETDDVKLAGSAGFKANIVVSQEKITGNINCELTSADVAYEWWFKKRPGIGAVIPKLNVEIIPGKSLILEGSALLESTPLFAHFEYIYVGKKFTLKKVNITTDALDINTASKCLRIPYTGQGGLGTNGYFIWEKRGTGKYGVTMRIGVDIDWATFLARDTEIPLEAKGISVQAFVDDRDPNNRTRSFTIKAKDAVIPPLGVKWLIPLRSKEEAEEERRKKNEPPPPPEYWTFLLNADKIKMTPWEGVEFSGIAYNRPTVSGLEKFQAKVGDGTIEGNYSVSSPENISNLTAKWDGIPVTYLIRHLELPEIMEGTCTGSISYELDLDDPNTLKGSGEFKVINGSVKTDLLLSRFAPDVPTSGFPSHLPFNEFSAIVNLDKDLVKTPNVQFYSEGLQITGSGKFVIDGDLDYDLSLTLSPQLASQITVIRDSFNVRGHQIIQSPIQLGFRLQGPSFKPRGEVKGLPPIGVTLVSGAAEITSEAIRVIDIPRKILIDLLRLGGGIVGSAGVTPR
ncbi:MAG: AsmA-like C-terminal region-containing protein [Candidatus Hydrogenedentes bacterium]|nr:AsmA-like C-terminal region-containing protein [Candidatus Hydrogenedentota bacterium]